MTTSGRHIALGTLSFAVCFAAWGLISAFAPRFRDDFHLTATETALLVAVPVLLGSLARLPIGLLADRFGARPVFTVLMVLCAIPAFLVPLAASYRALLAVAFFLGLAGSSFAVGVGYVSRWTPPGTAGRAPSASTAWATSASRRRSSSGRVLAGGRRMAGGVPRPGRRAAGAGPWSSRCSRATRRRAAAGDGLARHGARAAHASALAWVLSAFYFLTFGGFVAFSIYLPTLLRDQFGLTAGRRRLPHRRLRRAGDAAAAGRAAGSPTGSAARACSRGVFLGRRARSRCCSPGRR